MSMQTSETKKAVDPSLNDCANCGTIGANLTCAKCKATHYCSKACQKQHWRNGHKAHCVTPEERRPSVIRSAADKSERRPNEEGGAPGARDNLGECPICLNSLASGTLCTLPCKHEFHGDCANELRKQGVHQACPICRSSLPPGPEQLFEDATRMYVRMAMRRRRAVSGLEDGSMAHIIDMLTNAANQGHMRAQSFLAFIYTGGSGEQDYRLHVDYAEAARWYCKAAEQGCLKSQCSLGSIYHDGKGVSQDYKKALQWFNKAADQGHAEAQYQLGTIYHEGSGVSQDYKEAARWCRKAADQGHIDSQRKLAGMYCEGEGVAQDYDAAARWIRKAADQNCADSQYTLGIVYYLGKGIPQDYKKALKWYRKAADQGHAGAQFNLATSYHHGSGVSQDDKEAARCCRKAADQGHAEAQYTLAGMYSKGLGVAQDFKQEARWLCKAADQGSANAQRDLGAMYLWGDHGLSKDLKLAQHFLSAAEAQGDKGARKLLKKHEASLHDTSNEFSGPDAPPPRQCTERGWELIDSCQCCGKEEARNNVKLKPCPRCKRPLYCGKDCQRKHWNEEHKVNCSQRSTL